MGYAEKPSTCEGCPAKDWGLGFVTPTGRSDDGLTLVGLGPGDQDAWHSEPFYPHAPVGERLTKWLYRSGISKTHLSLGNLVQCWLPKSKKNGVGKGTREPTRSEIKFCWNAHVGPWLRSGEIKADPSLRRVLVPVGVPATKWLLGIPEKKGAEKFLGTMNEVELPEVGENG